MDIEQAENRLFELKQSMDLLDLVTGNPIEEDTNLNIKAIETVLNELEKKDRVINELVEEIAGRTGSCPYDVYDYDLDCDNKCKHDIEKECWIEYFTNKAENVGE